ncbi:MAG: hypothetical protein NTY31_01360 [Candidatus Falkowbacteria bacterium]|nr:hypothetical protein [Candidatus Falkowbacteria bacterium]
MSKPWKAISSIITVVIFLVLIAVTAVLYSGSPEQKVKMEQNFFWRNTKIAMDYVWIALQGVTDIGLGKESDNSGQVSSETEMAKTAETGFFKKIGSSIREEWDSGGEKELSVAPPINSDKVWQWRKNASGAEIIFRDKNGEEHKVSLPFKFLAE